MKGYGGAHCNVNGCGTVFKITAGGALTTLHQFCLTTGAVCTDGSEPAAGLLQGGDGDLYGTTEYGGADCSPGNVTACRGTVFKISASGALTTLSSFCPEAGCPQAPAAGLVQGANGDFYGTTESGGIHGVGTVFQVSPSGTMTPLHSFSGPDGAQPCAGLARAADGGLYGTTSLGGPSNSGTIFKIDTSGTLATVHSFNGTDGAYPLAGLVQSAEGDFYGTTEDGGANGCGTIFKVTSGGAETVFYNFCAQGPNAIHGDFPHAALVQTANGSLYGTTFEGGANTCESNEGCGTVFSLSLGAAAEQ